MRLKFSKSDEFNENYASSIIRIDNIRKHNNADRLQIVTVYGCNCIVGLDNQIGDLMLFCQTESTLNREFLYLNNLYEDKTLNNNKEEKGYINKHGRVRAIKLRGENSSGLLLPVSSLSIWFGEDIDNIGVTDQFDTINGIRFSKKYIPVLPKNMSSMGKGVKGLREFNNSQFRFHIDTPKLALHLHELNLDDRIQISSKWHGTSFVVSNILVDKKLNIFDKILKKFGFNISNTEYYNLYSSRTVIKNKELYSSSSQFYDVNIWEDINKKLKPYLSKGLSIYGEAVGYLPNSKTFIQKNFDYGCKEGEYKIYIYRITYTNPDGIVYEFTTQQIKQWCKQFNLMPVKELYYGTVYSLLIKYYISALDREWRDQLYEKLSTDKDFYMEENDPDCINDVPYEGIVIRKESLTIHSYKLKCYNFLNHETKENDIEGKIDIETFN